MKTSNQFIIILLAICFGFGGIFMVLAASPLGIWLSADSGIRDVIAELNAEFYQKIQDIRDSNPHDELVISGAQADWKEVLAVYAVRTCTDPDAPLDVVSMDESHKTILREIFWDINAITWQTRSEMIPTDASVDAASLCQFSADLSSFSILPSNLEIEPAYPEDPISPPVHVHSFQTKTVDPTCTTQGYTLYLCVCGYRERVYTPALGHLYSSYVVDPTTEEQGYTQYICDRCGDSYQDNFTDPIPEETEPPMVEYITLEITISSISAEEAAAAYSFTDAQSELLTELLLPENHRLWNDVIYGISAGGNTDIVSVAQTQIGNYNGNPYWTWYGLSERTEWCCIFVSWCANEVGLLDAGLVPKFAGTGDGVRWYRNAGRWQERGYTPAAGDLIFFNWDGDAICDHVGLVAYVEDGRVHTIEGNRSNSVIRDDYALDSSVIFGYGCVDYDALENAEDLPT